MDLSLLSGWHGLALGYAAVQAPMWVSMARARAPWHRYFTSPLVAAPLMVIAGVGVAAASAVVPGLDIAHGAIQWTLGLGVSGILGHIAGQEYSRGPAPDRLYQRGSVVIDRPAATPSPSRSQSQSRSASRSRSANQSQPGVIRLAGRAVSAEDETKHFKMIGTTGTGKSTAIQEILESALARGDRAIIADPDGAYAQRFFDPARGDRILNPFDEHSVKWDLFSEINNAHDVEQLARSFIPDHAGADRSWRGYARTFFTAVTRQVHDAGIRDVGELYRLLVVADADELRTLVGGTAAQPFLDEDNSRMFDSIRSVTSSAVGALEYVALQKGPNLSVRDWVRSDTPGVLFIPYKAGQIAALRSMISGWMRLAIFEAMQRGEEGQGADDQKNKPLWFVVDELDALGQIDGLKDALVRLRKFGGRCVVGFQSIAQVSDTYGHGPAHTIVENCGNSLILRCSASEGGGTAQFASDLIGEREVLRTTTSTSHHPSGRDPSTTQNQHFSVESAVMPSEIEALPDLVGYLKLASDHAWHRVVLTPLAAKVSQAWAQWRNRGTEGQRDPEAGRGAETRRSANRGGGAGRE